MVIGLIWPAFHFASYYLLFRKMEQFRTERGIFFLHFASFLSLSIVCIFTLFRSGAIPHDFAEATFSLSIHGIYSLSFLELWSLSQGSYSLRIASLISENRQVPERFSVQAASDIGSDKLSQRIESLRRLRFISADDRLTILGCIAASLLQGILYISSGKSLNK
jgi:hypothetical protein